MSCSEQKIARLFQSYHQRYSLQSAHLMVGRLEDSSPQLDCRFGPTGYFDLASLTKALVTSPLCLRYLDLESPIGRYLQLPDSISSFKVKDLMTHTTGVKWWSNFWVGRGFHALDRHKRWDVIQEQLRLLSPYRILVGPPRYSDVGYILLGAALEAVCQRSLDIIFREVCGVGELLTYDPDKARCIQTAYCPITGDRLRGVPHDENCRALGRHTGHAGLFGEASGLWAWLRDLWLDGGTLHQSQSKGLSIGWQKGHQFSSARSFLGGNTVGHLGFTGTSMWLCPRSLKTYILLTNRVYTTRQSAWIGDLRRELGGIAHQELV